MSREDGREPCLALFWEQADAESAAEHPLERELVYRLDAVSRYERLIADALAADRRDVLPNLTEQHERQRQVVARLRRALGDRSGDEAG
jgi:hypothetical protein